MVTEPSTVLVTADEFLLMPSHGMRSELIHGEVKTMTPAGSQHGWIASEFHWRLAKHVRETAAGRTFAAETGFRLAADHVRTPDVAFVRKERVDAAGDVEGFWPGAPDLAVEVLSPGDTVYEVEQKVAEWLGAGCQLVAVVNPKRKTVSVYRSQKSAVILAEGEILDASDIVPGWSLRVAEIFE